MKNIAVFVSGRGGFFKFLMRHAALLSGLRVVCVITDRNEPELRETARTYDLPVFHVSYKSRSRDEVDTEILEVLRTHNVDMLVLNYNRLLGPILTAVYKDIYNLHLSLLPMHKGFGAIEAAYHENILFCGVTFHHVDQSVDGGRIFSQVVIPKTPGMSLEEMTQKIFDHGCILQLDSLYKLGGGQQGSLAFYEGALYNPALSINVSQISCHVPENKKVS